MSIEPCTRPRIAVLLACFQGEAYIEAQLDSILAQTVPGIQIIVSDDGSADQTRRVLERHQRYYPEQIILRHREKDGEFKNREPFIPAPAMNFFWLMSQTDADYVLFCDQDDVWDSRKVEKLLKEIRQIETPGIPALVYSDMEVVDAGLQEISPSFFSYSRLDPDRSCFSEILVENPVTGGAMMINRPLLQLAGKVPRACFMHDWWVALCASCFGDMACVREPLSLYRQHRGNVLGARETGSVRDLCQRGFRQQQVEDNYGRMFAQAAAFGKMYWKQMDLYQKNVLRAFLSLPEKTAVQRLRTIRQYKFYKTSWLQTMAQCVTIPKDVRVYRKGPGNGPKEKDTARSGD